ncbi:MAG: lipoprotein insertase outer membrane protein LolB [Gammaproteobacteria bacterium]|nr:lipoprotein insertase outer membrane protein LolB [Gammaproteobacteria bacterium]
MIGRAVRAAGLAFMAAGLAACSTTAGVALPDLDDWETRRAVLTTAEEWEFSGRIGVRAGDEGMNGKLWWRQDGTVYRARISGPIGVGTMFINGDGREVSLTDGDGGVTELDDAERDLRERYGWTIPVTSLPFWTLGVPDPADDAAVEFNDDGLAASIAQREWRVTISEYADSGGQAMPRRLMAESGDIRVRLLIDSWTFR